MAQRPKKTATKPRYAVGYVRVSTAGQATEGVSLPAQRKKIRQYAELHGYELKVIHEDAGISAKRADNRPGLQAALDDVCGCKGVLLVHSLSRLARSARDCIDLSKQIGDCGAGLVSITQSIDTTNGIGKFFFTVMAAMDEFELDQVSERTKAGLAYKRERGEKTGGVVPYGFDAVERDGVKVLVKNVTEQRLVKRIMRLRSDARKSGPMQFKAIVDKLNSEDVKTKTGKPWTVDRVKWVHRNAK